MPGQTASLLPQENKTDQPDFTHRPDQRLIWATTRPLLEADNYKHKKYGYSFN